MYKMKVHNIHIYHYQCKLFAFLIVGTYKGGSTYIVYDIYMNNLRLFVKSVKNKKIILIFEKKNAIIAMYIIHI